MTGPWRRHRARAHNAGGVAVSLAFFGVSLVASLLAHGDTPAARRFVAHVASRLLSSLFEGRFELEGVGHVGFNGVDVGRVRIYDPSGQVVIEGRGLKARTFVPDILRRVLGGGRSSSTSRRSGSKRPRCCSSPSSAPRGAGRRCRSRARSGRERAARPSPSPRWARCRGWSS